jgi:N-acetylmuramoyl-L-alanine amidase
MRLICCKILVIILLTLPFTAMNLSLEAQTPYFIKKTPARGEGIYAFLRRYKLDDNACNLVKFLSLNSIDKNASLHYDKEYLLPIYIYDYDSKSIRSTIHNYDYNLALKIKKYNEDIFAGNLRQSNYESSKILWVPYSDLYCNDNISGVDEINISDKTKPIRTEPLFGDTYENVEVIDDLLKDRIFYLVSGHGGPDPGSQYSDKSRTLCEDEYSYDVILRLAKNLMEHNGTVYIMVKDKNDGIRDDKYLACDKDEVSYQNKELPVNQTDRLEQRTDEINELYRKHKKNGVKSQLAIEIHVDSRSYEKRQDVFFYHFVTSQSGKKTALSIHKTFTDKYRKVQSNRGYVGTVTSRDLFVLKNYIPTTVFIELANIKNINDQQRLIIADNRQALANWIYIGIKNSY